MCIAIQIDERIIRWSDESHRLPILRKDGDVEWVAWGMPFGQISHKAPAGSCASLDSVRSGKWKRYGARPVKIVADRFAVLDGAGAEHWTDLAAGLVLQGALIAPTTTPRQRPLGRRYCAPISSPSHLTPGGCQLDKMSRITNFMTLPSIIRTHHTLNTRYGVLNGI